MEKRKKIISTKQYSTTKKTSYISISFFVFSLMFFSISQAEEEKSLYDMLDTFGEIFLKIEENYVEDVSREEMIENAIQGMLSSLDPHSVYLNEKYYRDLRTNTRGKFGGLGIEISPDRSGYIRIISPIDDTPAEKAGIMARDLITHLNEVATKSMSLSEAVDMMRGEPGTAITITIKREGLEPFDVEITRAIITIQSVSSRLEGDYGYLRIKSFSEDVALKLIDHIKKLQKEVGDKKIKGYILDLRNNPGGLLNEAVDVTDVFLDRGEIVSTRGKENTNSHKFIAKKGDSIKGKPLVVLINGGSASASEIVAGALQDHHRAVIAGKKSFGKGSVQTILPLQENNTAIKLTTQRYYTPSGRSIQARGIEPDITIEQGLVENTETRKIIQEADLSGALENENIESESKDDTQTSLTTDDYQLTRAIDILKALAIYSQY